MCAYLQSFLCKKEKVIITANTAEIKLESVGYCIYSNKRRGAYLIFHATSAALIQGRHLFKHCTTQIYFFYIFIRWHTFYLLIFLWTDTNLTDSKRENTTLTAVKLITNRWAWALVPTRFVQLGNVLAWGGGLHGNPGSGPHQAPSRWTIQWNTYGPTSYLAPTSRGREGVMRKTKVETDRQTASYCNSTLQRTASKQLRIYVTRCLLLEVSGHC